MNDIDFAFQQPKSAKATAMQLAQKLDGWDMNKAREGKDCKIEDILYKGYSDWGLTKEAVERYMTHQTPQNCFIVHRNKAHKDLEDLRTEPIYNTQFKLKKIDDAVLDEWANAMPRPELGEVLGHPLQNTFVPTKTLTPVNIQLGPDEAPGKPVLIQGKEAGESMVWFKQDDQFN